MFDFQYNCFPAEIFHRFYGVQHYGVMLLLSQLLHLKLFLQLEAVDCGILETNILCEELTLENVLWSWCMVHSSCPRRIPYLINLWSSRLVIITVISVWSSCNITEHIPQLMASTFVFLVIAEVQQGEELYVPLGVQISWWILSIQITRTFFHTMTLRWWTFLTFKLYCLTEGGRTAAMMYILL